MTIRIVTEKLQNDIVYKKQPGVDNNKKKEAMDSQDTWV